MGVASSIFDCAVNPLHPLPEDGHADAAATTVVLDDAAPLRSSIIWKLQRAFYEKHGIGAWADDIVPNFVTSNSFIARGYARVILGLLQDVFGAPSAAPRPSSALAARNPAADYAQPVYIIEVGAGHGKLAYLICEALLRYRVFFPRTDCPWPFKYVVTDAIGA